jgi:hypothetical protein
MEINHLVYIIHPQKELLQGIGRDHPCILAAKADPPSQGEHSTDGITIGIYMADKQYMLSLVNELF